MTIFQSKQEIAEACDKIKRLLLSKNEKYGDAALNPNRILSKSGSVEQILIRIDDKLNRIQKGAGLLGEDEDVVQDLAGYFILLMIALNRQKQARNLGPKSIDDAWDHKEPETPSKYVGDGSRTTVTWPDRFDPRTYARILSTEECEMMGLPPTPQFNWIDGPEPELNEEPGSDWGELGITSEWLQRQPDDGPSVIGSRPGQMNVVCSGEGVGKSQLETKSPDLDNPWEVVKT